MSRRKEYNNRAIHHIVRSFKIHLEISKKIPQIEIDPDLPITPRKADIEQTEIVLEDHVQHDGGVPREGESSPVEQDTGSKGKGINPSENIPLRRSDRIRKKPSYLEDYT